MQISTCTRISKKKNMPSTEWSFYLLKTRTICVIFLFNCMQCINGSSILLQRYVTTGNDAKNPAFLAFVCYRKNPVKCNACAVARKIETDCLSRKCLFLAIQSLEFQEIWQKYRSEPTWMIYHEKSEFWHREFLIIQETINGELRKSPMSKFYENSVDKRDLMLTRSVQKMKTI